MRRSQWIFTAAVLVIGVGYLVMALAMPRGRLSYPGPGFYPVVVGSMFVLTSFGYLLSELVSSRPRRAQGGPSLPRPDPPEGSLTAEPEPGADGEGEAPPAVSAKALGLVGLMVLFVLALYYTGYLIAITFLLVLSIRAFGLKRWLPLLTATALMVGSSYLLFVRWLMVPLPKGMLW